MTRALTPGVMHRAGWSVVDQGLSSLTNFAVAIVIARTVSVSAFGAFFVAYSLYLVALQLSRALGTEPLLVRYSAASRADWPHGAARAAGTTLAIGVAAGLGTVAVSFAFDDPLRRVLLTVGVGLPGLLLQDAWRFAFFTQGRPDKAAINDLVWAISQFAALAALLAASIHDIAWLTFAWAASATLAAFVGAAQARVLPRLTALCAWLREHRDLAPRYIAEFVAVSASFQVAWYLVGIVAGLAALGEIRGAYVVMGPVNVLFLGVTAFAVPEGTRLLRDSPERLQSLARLVSVVLLALAVVWGAIALALPSNAGTALLGETWTGARAVLLPVALSVAAAGASLGPWTGLRALGAAATSLRVRLLMAPAFVGAGAGGALMAGAIGATVGIAVVAWVACLVWLKGFRRALQQQDAGGSHERKPAARDVVRVGTQLEANRLT